MGYSIAPLERLTEQLERLRVSDGNPPRGWPFICCICRRRRQRHCRTPWLTRGRKICECPVCCNLTDTSPCAICGDSRRDASVICVVEDARDVLAIERTREYHGLYHVLHGTISPMDGRGPEQLRIKQLLHRLEDERVTEVIMATNPTVEGDYTAVYLSRLLKPLHIKVTRLAYGIPVGADLEYADEVTLSRSLEGRSEL